jgi:ribosomal protein S18 acetylase RimI-like enzyme
LTDKELSNYIASDYFQTGFKKSASGQVPKKFSMITIRKATLNDSQAIASCLLVAMEDIVYRFIGENNAEKANEFMLFFVENVNNQYSYENCWVAVDNEKVIGAINVYDGALLTELRQPVVDHLRKKFGKELNVEDETQAGEFYIDTIGVHPNQQGKGIGTKLLQFVVDDFVTNRGHTLGLLVDDQNPNAKRLYLKLGFRSAGKRLFLGKNMEHLQVERSSPKQNLRKLH